MPECVRFPKLGTNITEGAVGAWRRREGDSVRKGEILVEIITSKATFEVESPAEGILSRILAPEKSNVPVGYVLAIVGGAGESEPEAEAENARLMAAFREEMAHKAAAGHAAASSVRATPGARRLAKEAGLRLEEVALAPDSNVLREEDVRKYLETRQRRASPPRGQ